jgi:hypothetical protein
VAVPFHGGDEHRQQRDETLAPQIRSAASHKVTSAN